MNTHFFRRAHALDTAGLTSNGPFRAGDTIRHTTLGKGRVLGYAAPGELRVQFEIGGEKTLLLRFQADKISKELP
jgi:hypothetical protein